jgi:hypothetical protein
MSVTPPAPPPAPAAPYPPHAGPHPHQPELPDKPCGCGCADGCGAIPELARLRYFHGQPLGALDLRREQSYHREKARLHNRLHHGWGFVCGLDIEIAPRKPHDECDTDPTVAEVIVMPGAALDCLGNDIVVRHPRPVYVDRLLDRRALERLTKQPATVYLTLCFQETPIDPMRPLLTGGCEPTPECEHGRILETYRICATLERPSQGPACEPCCGACDEACLELVAIRDFKPGEPLRQEQLDIAGRRALALHELSEIVGINWVHGATYSRDDANALLDDGIQLWFSRRVRVATLTRGVVELTGIESGAGRSASTYNIEGHFVGLPQDEYTDRLTYSRTTSETLQYGDRLLITVRGDFILDECCRALDGNHIGGGVPLAGDPKYGPLGGAPERVCPPRKSGDGIEGGDFVSWIYVEERGEKR